MSVAKKAKVIPDIIVAELAKAKRIKLTHPPGFGRVKIGGDTVDISYVLEDLFHGRFALQEQVRTARKLRESAARIKQLEDLVDDGLKFQQVRNEIFNLREMPSEWPDWLDQTNIETPANANTAHSSKGKRVPITIWSDWHYGEVVNRDQMGGSNEFDLSIADRRIEHLVSKTIDVCKNHQDDTDYPGIVVCLGGDMISGDIHEELKETNELPTLLTVHRLADRLAWALTEMANEFGQVVVPCVTGNHGRMGKKPQAKGYNEVNFETILYLAVQDRLRNDKRVQMVFPNDTIVHFQVHGHRYALTHGNLIGARGGDGHIGPIGPIMRGTMKTNMSESSMAQGRAFDTLIMGHWHKIMMLSEVIVNGSLKGYDDFARNFLRVRFEAPMQALWFHGPKGALQHHRILCDPDTKDHPESGTGPWVGFHKSDVEQWERLISDGKYWMDNSKEPSNDNHPEPANDNKDVPVIAPKRPRRGGEDDMPEPSPAPTMGGGKGGAKRKRRG